MFLELYVLIAFGAHFLNFPSIFCTETAVAIFIYFYFFHTSLFLRYHLFQINPLLYEKAKYMNENAIN